MHIRIKYLTFFFLFPLFYVISYYFIGKSESIYQFNSYQSSQIKVFDSINPPCTFTDFNKHKSFINVERLEIYIPDSRGWLKNLFEAKYSPSNNIVDKYKKKI